MTFLLDTNVLIELRDTHDDTPERVAALRGAVVMSVISRVELEGGAYRDSANGPERKRRLDLLVRSIPALDFDGRAADAYREILRDAGYSRRKILDRMIAAQAIVHRATLVTRNARDYSDIRQLTLLSW